MRGHGSSGAPGQASFRPARFAVTPTAIVLSPLSNRNSELMYDNTGRFSIHGYPNGRAGFRSTSYGFIANFDHRTGAVECRAIK
jgi:hypothetical protein